MKILLTGPPGIGKTTCIKNLIRKIQSTSDFSSHINLKGFWTMEIREKQQRMGFYISDFNGNRGILSHVNIESRFKVGKYGVNIEEFERIALPTLSIQDNPQKTIFFIDEIGKMECFSIKFCNAIRKILDSESFMIATIAVKGPSFIQEIKSYPNVEFLYLNMQNRNEIVDVLVRKIFTQN